MSAAEHIYPAPADYAANALTTPESYAEMYAASMADRGNRLRSSFDLL